jgi:two-component system NarL family sensor kinase
VVRGAATAAAESERLVAWLRLPAVVLLGVGGTVAGAGQGGRGYGVAVAAFAAWAVGIVAWVHLRPAGEALVLVTAAVDIGAITALAYLSGGGFSQARVAYAIVPITLAFRFRPGLVAVGGAAVVVAYLAQALGHPSRGDVDAERYIAVQAGYLVWIGLASAVLAYVLARRTRRIAELAAQAHDLLADALGAEERERQRLAETLHDSALQNLLAVRHDLQEVAEEADAEPVRRAEETVVETVGQLREVVADLHPLVLEQAGLEAALSAVAAQASRRGGFRARVVYEAVERPPHERLLLAAARELLANAATHARAGAVDVGCVAEGDDIVLTVRDDGVGFDPARAAARLADGHIGLASQRARVEGAGGSLTVVAGAGGRGTIATVRLPAAAPPPPGAARPLGARSGRRG